MPEVESLKQFFFLGDKSVICADSWTYELHVKNVY